MSHYRSNLRDIQFNLFEVFGLEERLTSAPFTDLDPDTVQVILTEIDRLARGPLADSFTHSDRHPPHYDPTNRTVTIPEPFHRSYQALLDAEWWRLDVPTELGGMGAPPSLRWAASELFLGSNPAAFFYAAGPNFAGLLHQLGTPDQQRLAELIIDKGWGATMVLTEPDAGTDVGAGRTTAYPNPDGTWRIEGVKRFITSGEHDLTDNIIHFVLARPQGAPPGTKGLSLFIVPKFHVDLETGELGERNGVYATNVEKKMGLKVSATCELTFGAEHPATGTLLGDQHDGIAQMFKVIEYARMLIGAKSIATLSTGYLNALEYATTRIQGPDMAAMADKTSPRVPILRHPGVRSMLMTQKAYVEGLRALLLFTAYWQDLTTMAHAGDTSIDVTLTDSINDLLLPVVKGVGSERSNELLAMSLQVFGGSGYLQDYPIEQYRRDTQIDTLYEGPTLTQSQDFLFRKIFKNQFQALAHIAGLINETVATAPESFTQEAAAVHQALEDVQATLGKLGEWALSSQQGNPTNIYLTGQHTNTFLMMAGDLLIGWLLLRQAIIAEDQLLTQHEDMSPQDGGFYQGKITTARWFAANRLPLLSGQRTSVDNTTLEIMELPDGAW